MTISRVKIAATAIVCEEAILEGDITIGENTIVHPKCSILATGGPIVIGDGNVLEEGVVIENVSPLNQVIEEAVEIQAATEQPVMTIGNGNLFQAGCSIRARLIGNDNLFEPKCHLAINSIITSACIIGARVEILPAQSIEDSTILVKKSNGELIRRAQKNYQLEAHQTLVQCYATLFSDKSNRWYMGNFHHLRH